MQTDDHTSKRRFSAPRLAYQAHHLTASNGEIDVVDRAHRLGLDPSAEEAPGPGKTTDRFDEALRRPPQFQKRRLVLMHREMRGKVEILGNGAFHTLISYFCRTG
ncbi:hypothetical protein SAMN05444746_12251 [Variovorax sp. OK212]|nr:hypothetical protein SAMN05518853_12251 [Variovorax sp. OK202]SFE36142.1 hypothetical protein SAMN05444746_12251 [Variovorax sp. OK212]